MAKAYEGLRNEFQSRSGKSSRQQYAGDQGLPAAMHPVEFSQLEAACAALTPVRAVEWGSGGSTIAIPDRVDSLQLYVSVEHNRHWHERVAAKIDAARVVLELREPAASDPEPAMFEQGRGKVRPEYKAWADRCEDDSAILRDYVNCPAEHADTYDLAFIDGRSRRQCISRAWDLLRPGGLLVVHDAQRTLYHPALYALGPPPRFLRPWVYGQLCLVTKPKG